MPPPAPVARPSGGGTTEGLNPRYTFDTFVVGSSNQFAQAACQAVAELPSKAYNPLFIYGGVGLGKTHLLHAVGHETVRLFQGMTVVYLSSERFTNELINAIRYDRTAEFRARYRTIDLLLIDDIQFISGKERTQEEFFHTFNDLYESRKQIIVSSDCSPKDIPEIEERLRSRFEWGLIADIQPPDFETRVAILKKKAALERVRLADDVAYLIASRVKSNIRELEGSLTRMIAFCALTGREMSVDLAQEVLSDLWGEEEKIITIEQIQRKVSDFFGVKLSDLKAKNRTQGRRVPPPDRHVPGPPAHPRLALRGRPLLRRQGPHDRAPRGGQDPDPAAGRSQTTQDDRRTYPGDHPVIHTAPRRSPQRLSPTRTTHFARATSGIYVSITPSTPLDGYDYDEVVSSSSKQQRRFSWKSSWIATRSSRASRWCRTSSSLGRPCRSSPMCCSRPRRAPCA